MMRKTQIERYCDCYGVSPSMLANMIGADVSSVESWVSGEKDPDVRSLRDMAAFFKCSTRDLMSEKEVDGLPRSSQSFKSIYARDGLDGFVGVLGIGLKGRDDMLWYPISEMQWKANRKKFSIVHDRFMRDSLSNGRCVVETLSNRLLIMDLKKIDRFCFQPAMKGKQEQVYPLVVYEGLDTWLQNGGAIVPNEDCSSVFCRMVEEFVHESGLDQDGIQSCLHLTEIYGLNGAVRHVFAEDGEAMRLVKNAMADNGSGTDVVWSKTGLKGKAISWDHVSLIDMPLLEVMAGEDRKQKCA